MSGNPTTGSPEPGGDPWAAFGVLVAGVMFYGGIGWALSVWLKADYWIPIGILVGAGFGVYLVFARYSFKKPDENLSTPGSSPPDEQPDDDHRGETA